MPSLYAALKLDIPWIVYHLLEQVCVVCTSLFAGRMCGHSMYCDSIRTSKDGAGGDGKTTTTKQLSVYLELFTTP